MTVEMVEAAVKDAAQKIQSAAEQCAGIKPGERLAAVASALPGSTSAPKASALATEWAADLDAWRRKAVAQHTAMVDASDEITRADVLAQNRFGGPQAVI